MLFEVTKGQDETNNETIRQHELRQHNKTTRWDDKTRRRHAGVSLISIGSVWSVMCKTRQGDEHIQHAGVLFVSVETVTLHLLVRF